jgi:hypothetical protein
MNRFVLIVLSLVAAVAAGPDAAAKSRVHSFDGQWTVDLIVINGICPQGYAFPVRLDGSRVVYGGHANVAATGAVAGSGRISASFARQGETLRASGRLVRNSGTGVWRSRSPSRNCSGRWEARRER